MSKRLPTVATDSLRPWLQVLSSSTSTSGKTLGILPENLHPKQALTLSEVSLPPAGKISCEGEADGGCNLRH